MSLAQVKVYRLIPHTSDLEVLVEADSFEELVKESVVAVTEAVAGNVQGHEKRKFSVDGDHEEMLMKVLEEVVYLQSAEQFYVREARVRGNGRLEVELIGGRANARDEIKAVTWHEFWVKPGWKAHFICDL